MGAFYGSPIAGFVLAAIVFAPSYLPSWYFSIFIVTDQRFIQITQKGCSIGQWPILR